MNSIDVFANLLVTISRFVGSISNRCNYLEVFRIWLFLKKLCMKNIKKCYDTVGKGRRLIEKRIVMIISVLLVRKLSCNRFCLSTRAHYIIRVPPYS